MRRPLAALLTALVAVLALVAPVHPATSMAAPGDPLAAASQVEPAVARIDTELHYQNAIGNGTGIVLDPGGQVMTNFHVVAGADLITATVVGRSFPAEFVGYDRRHDIAVLRLLGGGGLPVGADRGLRASGGGRTRRRARERPRMQRAADPRGRDRHRVSAAPSTLRTRSPAARTS